MPLKIFEMGLQIKPLPQTSYIAFGKGKKIENLIFISAVVKMYTN